MILLVDNRFSRLQGVARTVTANEAEAGHEVGRLANARRSSLDYWTPTTANAQATVKTVTTQPEAFDFAVLDRGHNLASEQVVWECSADDFTTSQTMADLVIPASPGTGHVDDALGVVTQEGAWLKRLPVRAESYSRLRIPAMGASLKPQVVGAWLGLSVEVDGYMPWDPDATEFGMKESVSDLGWRGRRSLHRGRAGVLHLRTTSLVEAEGLRWHLALYTAGRPMWVIPDPAQADRAMLVQHPGGRTSLEQNRQYFFPHGDLPYVEVEPLVLT